MAVAAEGIGDGVETTGQPRAQRRGTSQEHVGQAVDGIGEVEDAGIVQIRGVLTGQPLAAEEPEEDPHGVGEVDRPIAVGIAAAEVLSPEGKRDRGQEDEHG
jgi:hypothetical protein